ncbi:ATP-dependent DNA helicase [Trichonephila clavipes]|nr:ATP-dependent DNA helicase [Trichonephila clavipes]
MIYYASSKQKFNITASFEYLKELDNDFPENNSPRDVSALYSKGFRSHRVTVHWIGAQKYRTSDSFGHPFQALWKESTTATPASEIKPEDLDISVHRATSTRMGSERLSDHVFCQNKDFRKEIVRRWYAHTTASRRAVDQFDQRAKLQYRIISYSGQSETEPRLLPEQKCMYNKILQRVELGEGSLFFLDAQRGAGKTLLLNLLIAKIRKDRNVALVVASSGIAATLRNVQLFSGFESEAYAHQLQEIDEGHLDTDQEGMVLFTHQCCHVVESEDELIDPVFLNLQQYILDENWLCDRIILAPKYETVAKINKKILSEIASETSVYNSIDTAMSFDDTTSYPVKFLNFLEFFGSAIT